MTRSYLVELAVVLTFEIDGSVVVSVDLGEAAGELADGALDEETRAQGEEDAAHLAGLVAGLSRGYAETVLLPA